VDDDWTRNNSLLTPVQGRCYEYPNIFSVAKAQRPTMPTFAFHSWDNLERLMEPRNTIDILRGRDCSGCSESCVELQETLCNEFADQVAVDRSGNSLMFLYMDILHECGDAFGINSYKYAMSMRAVDLWLSRIMTAIEDSGPALLNETLLMIVSNHGRAQCGEWNFQGLAHQSTLMQWLMWGGSCMQQNVSLADGNAGVEDVAPTIMHALGLRSPAEFRGRPFLDGFLEGTKDWSLPVQMLESCADTSKYPACTPPPVYRPDTWLKRISTATFVGAVVALVALIIFCIVVAVMCRWKRLGRPSAKHSDSQMMYEFS